MREKIKRKGCHAQILSLDFISGCSSDWPVAGLGYIMGVNMLEKIKEIIAEQLAVDASTITEDSTFKEDLGADSLELFELIMAMEEEYDIEIPSEDLNSLKSVGDLITYLKNKGVE